MLHDDTYRFHDIREDDFHSEAYRSDYRRDFARVLHSASFRRLEHKTQLFPGNESDFFRNRLTHSLEVAQIAKTIALKLLHDDGSRSIEPDVCEIAGLAHDLGHPPFGHNGERALDDCMKKYGGFEGNAQTLRILTRLEKKERDPYLFDDNGNDLRVGLNLTARSIASALKYDQKIVKDEHRTELEKGYYESEAKIVKKVKQCIVGDGFQGKFKTIECGIMDLADDIAYSVYDMEDAFKAGFLTPYDILSSGDSIYQEISSKLEKSNIRASIDECRAAMHDFFNIFWAGHVNYVHDCSELDPADFVPENIRTSLLSSYIYSKEFVGDGYRRTEFSSRAIGQFVHGIVYKENSKFPPLSKVDFNPETKLIVNILKHFTYESQINSPRLKVAENRGYDIVKKIFVRLANEYKGHNLLPDDYRGIYNQLVYDEQKKRLICDFIAGMTDRYAIEFYGRLFSENPQSFFKPF